MKDKYIKVRVSQEEQDQIRTMAKSRGLSISALLLRGTNEGNVQIQLTRAEKQAVENRAAEHGMSFDEYLHYAALHFNDTDHE